MSIQALIQIADRDSANTVSRLSRRMESTGELVPFPLLNESNYRACTIPYRFASDNPKKPTPTELSWINLFLNSVTSFKYHLCNPSYYLFDSLLFYVLPPPINTSLQEACREWWYSSWCSCQSRKICSKVLQILT